MDDLISRSAAKDYIAKDFGFHFPLYDGTRLGATRLLVTREDVISAIEHNIPTIDAEPVRHGEWFDKGSLSCRCSECGCKNTRESAFCPNCGAKMDLT